MIKLLLIVLVLACETIPTTPTPPTPEPTQETPTAPRPPVLTQKCIDSELVRKDLKDKIYVPHEDYYKYSVKGFTSKKNIVYLNFEGRQIKKGFGSGDSFIVCSRKNIFVGGSNISLERRKKIEFFVKGYFKDIGIDIEISHDLNSDTMLEMIIGGRYKDLKCGSNKGILGVAPLDIGNRRVNEVGFAFVNNKDSDYMIASTIAHEMAHTYGLDHIKNKCGVMYYAITDYIVGFKKGRLDFSIRYQDGKKLLRKNLK